jgi:hypothetical protein
MQQCDVYGFRQPMPWRPVPRRPLEAYFFPETPEVEPETRNGHALRIVEGGSLPETVTSARPVSHSRQHHG